MKDGSDFKMLVAELVLGMTGLSCRKEGETQTSDCRY